MRRCVAVLLCALCCCAEAPGVDAMPPDDCGDAPGEPRRFAALSPDERLERIARLDGSSPRAVFEIGQVLPHEPGTPAPASEPQRLLPTDACGRDEVALPGTRVAASNDDVLLTCDAQSGVVVAVDPQTGDPGDTLFVDVDCEVAIAGDHALAIAFDDASPRVVTTPLVGGAVRTLMPAVAAVDPLPLAIDEQTVLGLTPAGRLVTLGVPDAEELHARDGVAQFRLSPDGRFLLLQDGTPSADAAVASTVRLLDRQTDAEVVLAQTALAWTSQPWFSDLILLAPQPGKPVQIFEPDTGAEVTLPDGTQLRGTVGDGRLWIAATPLSYGLLSERIWDPRSGEASLLYEGEGFASGSPEGLVVYVPSGEAGIQRGTLLRVGWDGTPAEVVANEVGWHRRKVDAARWLSVLADETGDYGTLVLHGPDARRTELDHGVHVFAPALVGSLAPDDPLVYAVSDGTQSGLFRVVPP
ncbi:MAG: hypothetical protein AAF721_20200 [Myxococcota bacterium]